MSNPQAAGDFQLLPGRVQVVHTASVNVADPAGLPDLQVNLLSMDAVGRLRVLASLVAGSTIVATPPAASLVDSLGATNRVVAPVAGGAIVTVAAPPAGTYEVEVLTSYDGAVAAVEINNLELREGVVVVSALLAPSVANVVTPVRTFKLVLDGATAVSINATGAGTAGVGYNAELVLRRIA